MAYMGVSGNSPHDSYRDTLGRGLSRPYAWSGYGKARVKHESYRMRSLFGLRTK